MEIQLHGRLVSCTPEEYKRLIDLHVIEVPVIQQDHADWKPNPLWPKEACK